MLTSIVRFIVSIWNFFIHSISGLVGLVTSSLTTFSILTEVINLLPSIVSIAVTITIVILILKFFIGRS